jgi:hypothetical protein
MLSVVRIQFETPIATVETGLATTLRAHYNRMWLQ